MNKLKIVLILDNKDREYNYLQLLKKTLIDTLNTEVSLIGSVAEQERMYFLLYKIKPNIVFLSQAVEESMKDIAFYIKQSGGLVFILPAEITIIPAISHLIVNKKLKYNKYTDAIFLPGKRMMQLYKSTDVSPEKIYVVGSPKIDVLINDYGNEFLKRSVFLSKYKINPNRRNIFIFTSFVIIPSEFFSINESFKSSEKKFLANNAYTFKSKSNYIDTIKKLTNDFPKLNIILKIHPLEDKRDYQSISAPNFYFLPKIPLYNCLDSIDLSIHWSSTVATECWIKKIKTLQYVPFIKNGSLSEFRLGNPTVSSYEDLIEAIKIYLNKKVDKKFLSFQKKYLEDNYYKLDGKSCLRIKEVIRKNYANKKIEVNYQSNFNKLIYFIVFIQKFFGLKISRLITNVALKEFNPEYTIKNFVEEVR